MSRWAFRISLHWSSFDIRKCEYLPHSPSSITFVSFHVYEFFLAFFSLRKIHCFFRTCILHFRQTDRNQRYLLHCSSGSQRFRSIAPKIPRLRYFFRLCDSFIFVALLCFEIHSQDQLLLCPSAIWNPETITPLSPTVECLQRHHSNRDKAAAVLKPIRAFLQNYLFWILSNFVVTFAVCAFAKLLVLNF